MQHLIASIAFIFIFTSCTDNSKNNLAVFRASEEGLQQSIKIISQSNKIIYHSLEDRLADPRNRDHRGEYILKWQPKALQVKNLSDSIIKYIKAIKEELVNETGPNKPGDKELIDEDNLTVTDHVFKSHGKGKELFEKLIKYRQDILAIDPELKNVFEHDIMVFAGGFNYKENGPEEFTKTFFGNIPLIAAMAMLSKFENNVKINENNIISFCHNKTYPVLIIDDFPQPLISQSKSYVKAGEEIEITAGIGTFSAVVQPKFVINGKIILTKDEPIAIYKLKAPVKPGKHYVLVEIEFVEPDGTKTTMKKNITYTVID